MQPHFTNSIGKLGERSPEFSASTRDGMPCFRMTGFLIAVDGNMSNPQGMEVPQNPLEEPSPANSENQKSLSDRRDEAWSQKTLKTLGDSQRSSLAMWEAKDRQDKGDDYLTVPVLQGMLEILINYYPEKTSSVFPN